MDIPPFTITIEVELNHCLRSEIIRQTEPWTDTNHPIAIAIRDKLAHLAIPFTGVFCIIDPQGLGCYSKIWGIPFNGKRYAYEAHFPRYFAQQWHHFCSGRRLSLIFTLDFFCLGECKLLETLPKKPYLSRIGRCLLYAALTAFVLWLIGWVSQGPLEVLGTVGAMVVFLHPRNLLAINDPDATW